MKSTDSICTANVECLPIWMKSSSIKKWFSMPVVREWHMHAKCDRNILCGQELWTFSRTANGRTSGRTQIVIIVQIQGSYNSTFLKLSLEKGIFSPVVLSCQYFGQRGWYERKFHLCNPPLSAPWPCESIWFCWGLHLVSPSALFDSPHSVC